MRFLFLKEIGSVRWNELIVNQGIQSAYHCADVLEYYALSCDGENLSFILNDQDTNNPIGVCPIILTKSKDFFDDINHEISINGTPVPSPLIFLSDSEHENRRKLRLMESALYKICHEKKIGNINYIYRSVSYVKGGDDFFNTRGLTHLMHLGFSPTLYDSVVVDLRKTEFQLEVELAKSHRKEIRKSRNQGQKILIVNAKSDYSNIKKYFDGYEYAHFISAGRRTRPASSFNKMMKMIENNCATLFVNIYDNQPVSYLYCMHSHGQAFGCSQVNTIPRIVDSPRHLLEWEAVLYFKNEGYFLYEVGQRYSVGQAGVVHSDKLKSIGFFKERFGGVMSTDIVYSMRISDKLTQFKKAGA